ncbi:MULTISPECIES: PEPxxWA-CTERM sorting domain-containing protein [Sphingomonas]|uniref:PEPxxWA-CTERM sorting domain-containing protein n=1 Tax=Sphingomonas TaxID=13687 RepID=UPI000DEEF73E|nr:MULTISPECIES: PEPxxWA-CTERM sorting domain-containing protein [Sphingomonas]
MNSKLLSMIGLAAAALSATPAAAQQYVTNGNFNSVSNNSQNFQVNASNQYGSVTGWSTGNSSTSTNPYNLLYHSDIATSSSALGQYQGTGREFLWALPSNNAGHGNFMALDGDTSVNGTFSTILTGLTTGALYTLSFDWATGQIASRTGATTEGLNITVGNLVISLPNQNTPSEGATPWSTVTRTFTATGATQTLSFLATGTPNGLPPVALLDNVSVTAAVPEPATWALMLIGFGAVGVSMRKRRAHIPAMA